MLNKEFMARDLAVLWHPCTQMQDHESLPLIPIRSGQGVWLEDLEGKRYLDAISSWWVNIFGHNNPLISTAIKQQLDRLEHVILAGFSHEPAVELAERLVAMTPDRLSRVFYADNGSAAVEVALKMSFHYWLNRGEPRRQRFVNLSGSYHGETLGALALGDVSLYKDTYGPLLLEPIVAPSPDAWQGQEGEDSYDTAVRCLLEMEKILSANSGEICAVIVEPLIQCAGGMRMYHPHYLSGLRSLCDQYNVHLIADEIAVGFGRTGTMFACEQADISPDFMCLSKGLTGGYLPMSAVLTSEDVYSAFYSDYASLKGFLHSHSYTGNALACAAALATLDIFANQPVLENNVKLAALMMDSVSTLTDHPHVGEIRQTGMVLAIEMVKQRETREAWPWQERRGLEVYQYGLSQGVLLRPLGNIVYFMPPYVINAEEIALMGRVAIEGIERACSQ
ncbi:MAG: adenosylmethionine--8-amino-7-oxononanoate transaminase [Proteobacteria bacterium]|nr:adenosylmethionine--8-amino-7-oxononanoate transaminase [Pseudomonadota bacterium]